MVLCMENIDYHFICNQIKWAPLYSKEDPGYHLLPPGVAYTTGLSHNP